MNQEITRRNITSYDLLLLRQSTVRIKKLIKAKNNLQHLNSAKASLISIEPSSLRINSQSQNGRINLDRYLKSKKLPDNKIVPKQQPMRAHHRPEFLTPVLKIRNGHYKSYKAMGSVDNINPEFCAPELEISQMSIPVELERKGDKNVQRLLSSKFRDRVLTRNKVLSKILNSSSLRHHSIDCAAQIQNNMEPFTLGALQKGPTQSHIQECIVTQERRSQQDWRRWQLAKKKKKLVFSGLRTNQIKPWDNETDDASLW